MSRPAASPRARVVAAIGMIAAATSAAAQTPQPADAAVSQLDRLIEQPIAIPSDVPGVFGTRHYTLEGLVVRPAADRPLPLALITHGTPREAADRRKLTSSGLAGVARNFARRGWVAVVVMRRGHGTSEGEYEEGMVCANPDYVRSGRVAVIDLTNAVRHLSAQPYVDGSRVLGIGQSTGGFAWLATSADPPPNLAAVINFAGGHGSLRPRENCSESNMLLAMRTFGATSRVPSLWIYAANDSYVVPDFAARMHASFAGAGGPAELQAVPAFDTDGHVLFYRGARIWTPLVDDFLRRHDLPTWSPVALPEGPIPAARRANYQNFIAAPVEKAFALALDGTYSAYWGGVSTIEEAKQRATAECEAGVRRCRIVAVNFAMLPEAAR